VRLDSWQFAPSRAQAKVLRRFSEHLSGARPITLPEEDRDVLERCLRGAEKGRAREVCELVCRERARGDPLGSEDEEEEDYEGAPDGGQREVQASGERATEGAVAAATTKDGDAADEASPPQRAR
jgi:hypothetical protein